MRQRLRILLRVVLATLTLLCAAQAYALWNYGPGGAGGVMVRAVRLYEIALGGALFFGACFLLSLSPGRK